MNGKVHKQLAGRRWENGWGVAGPCGRDGMYGRGGGPVCLDRYSNIWWVGWIRPWEVYGGDVSIGTWVDVCVSAYCGWVDSCMHGVVWCGWWNVMWFGGIRGWMAWCTLWWVGWEFGRPVDVCVGVKVSRRVGWVDVVGGWVNGLVVG